MFTIGIDLGTTGCKAVVSDINGQIQGQQYIEYPLIILSSEMIEQDAHLWWELSCKAVISAVKKSGVKAEAIKGISVSSQGISFVLVDKYINPLGNAISWLDTRAKAEKNEIETQFSEKEIFDLTGKKINEIYVLPKLMWIKKNNKTAYEIAYKLLMAHDFIIAKMTGRCITDSSMAGGTMMYNVRKCCWCTELLDNFNLNHSLLPDVLTAGDFVGKLTENAAQQMGLNPDTAVAAGGQDQKVAAFFAKPDLATATLCLGTAGAMEFILEKPIFDEKMRLPLFPYLEKNTWTLESVVSVSGAALKWYRNVFFQNVSFQELDYDASNSKVGSNGVFFYPHFGMASSPHWVSDIKGMFYGLTLDSKKEDITRSILEGIAFQIKTNLDICEQLSGEIENITVFGSGSSSEVWCKIFADVTNKNIIALSSPDASGLGAAKLAFMAVGSDLEGFSNCRKNNSRQFAPNPEHVNQYRQIYEEYIKIEQKMIGQR